MYDLEKSTYLHCYTFSLWTKAINDTWKILKFKGLMQNFKMKIHICINTIRKYLENKLRENEVTLFIQYLILPFKNIV